jgi:hypothetical protein
VGRVCNAHGNIKTGDKLSVGKSEEKKRLERPRYKWHDNTNFELKR